jgi:RNA polymerase sigma factor (sigma-70 family)
MVDRFGRLVFSVARREGLGAADAEDVFQDVFATLHRTLAGLRDESRLASWLVTTTIRASRHHRRRRCPAELPADRAGDGPLPEEEIASIERRQLVRQALRQLGGTGERLLTALFSGDGRPDYRKIARELGIPVGSIGPTRARCFRKLEKILRDMGIDGREPAAEAAGRLLRIAG